MSEEKIKKRMDSNLQSLYDILKDLRDQSCDFRNTSMDLRVGGEVFKDLFKKIEVLCDDFLDFKYDIKQNYVPKDKIREVIKENSEIDIVEYDEDDNDLNFERKIIDVDYIEEVLKEDTNGK